MAKSKTSAKTPKKAPKKKPAAKPKATKKSSSAQSRGGTTQQKASRTAATSKKGKRNMGNLSAREEKVAKALKQEQTYRTAELISTGAGVVLGGVGGAVGKPIEAITGQSVHVGFEVGAGMAVGGTAGYMVGRAGTTAHKMLTREDDEKKAIAGVFELLKTGT